jgi:acyl-coenzyme A thioesterase PaaI-like protein
MSEQERDFGTRARDVERINVDMDHNCFGCGRLNAHGLQLTFYPDERGGVWSRFVPEERFEGYTGMVHGGVISTVLDEVMAWSLYREQIWAVTGSLSVRYRAPIRVGQETRAIGWQVDRRGRRIEMAGEIQEVGGKVLASATATFVQVPESQAEEWRSRYQRDAAGQLVSGEGTV